MKKDYLIGSGLFAALLSSVCCIVPVLSLIAGVGGIASAFSWMDGFRPYLIGFTMFVLAFAWYQKLKPRTQEEIACACDDEEKPFFWQSRKFLGIVTVFAVAMMAFPSYSGIFFSDQPANEVIIVKENDIVEANLTIKGMTCAGCEHSVNHSLTSALGVVSASSSFQSGLASVKYDSTKVTLEALASVVEMKTGYKVTIPIVSK